MFCSDFLGFTSLLKMIFQEKDTRCYYVNT